MGGSQSSERSDVMSEEGITRRDVIKRAGYMTPVILTFLAAPAFVSGGSGRNETSEEYGKYETVRGNGKKRRRWLWGKRSNKSGGGDNTNPGGGGNEGGYNNPGKGEGH
jgi:hypothetical protein